MGNVYHLIGDIIKLTKKLIFPGIINHSLQVL